MDYTIIGKITGLDYKGNNDKGFPDFIHIETEVFNQKMPILLELIGDSIPKYLHELYGTDCEEKYMKKKFTYSPYSLCLKIEVLDENNKTVKTVDLYTDETKFLNFID